MSIIKKEINKPSYDYLTDNNNAWSFYNHVTHALKLSTPRDWLQDSQNFHDFMMSDVVNNQTTNTEKWELVGINGETIEIDEELEKQSITIDECIL